MKASRLGSGELIALGGGIALFASLFLTWFSVSLPPMGFESMPDSGLSPDGIVRETGLSGWNGLDGVSGFLIALAAFAGMGLAAATAFGVRVVVGASRRGAPTASLGALAVGLILWQMFVGPGGPEAAAFLGLAAAALVAGGGLAVARDAGLRLFESLDEGRPGTAGGDPEGGK